MLKSLDTETTGLDVRHGAKPFFVTMTGEDEITRWWEWPVNPLTREPQIPEGDLLDILREVEEADELVLQNCKFDVAALGTLMGDLAWPWEKTHDTLNAGHLLASNQPHDLTSMSLHYLGIDIEPYEKALEKATKEARSYCQRKLQHWRIAKEGDPDIPSAGDKTWKYDTWLPAALARHFWEESEAKKAWDDLHANQYKRPGWEFHPPEIHLEGSKPLHPWYTVLRDYANADSAVTMALWKVQREQLKERNLWKIYEEMRHRPYFAARLEATGITVSRARLEEQVCKYGRESQCLADRCLDIAADLNYDLELPRSGRNHSLQRFVFDVLGVPPVSRTPAGQPAMDRAALVEMMESAGEDTPAAVFLKALMDKRSRDTAVQYLAGYKRYWLPLRNWEGDEWFKLYPSLNPVGTDTLRWSSQNPNEQNISAKEGFNIRYAFGPAPGREWWSMDAQNIELRIPAYECGEEAFIQLFERPNDPPYFGSNHLLVAHLLHKELFESCVNEDGEVDGRLFKDGKSTKPFYKRTKNGNFAVQYQCGERRADATYGVRGAFQMIRSKFTRQAALSDHWVKFAERNGYVETMPDKEVDPERGYPLLCTRTEHGKILTTVPLSYHIQGTACWWMLKAMKRCLKQLDQWNSRFRKEQYKMVLQIHDEIVFDFPKAADPVKDPDNSNLGKARILQALMAKGGDDLGVPTPVSVHYHPDNWSDEVSL